jgi:hypothetical protein
LEYQKRLKKKYARDEDGVMRDYTTSLMYTTKRYSAKIYHKGSEYEKNDLKQHYKINREKGHEYFKTKDFQNLADKTLRYELTIRNTMLNYLHKKHLFRVNCPQHRIAYSNYEMVENAKQRNDRISKKVGTLEISEKEAYLKENPYEKISQDSRRVHKYISSLITKRTYFMLTIQEEAKIYNRMTVNNNANTALFFKGLLTLCLNKLFEFIGEFQIKELPEEENVRKQIELYNSMNKAKLPTAEMVRFYDRLKESGSFKETAKFYGYSRASLYRYKAWFKKVGITDSNVLPLSEVKVPDAPIDFRNYHSVVTYNPIS